MTSAKQLKESSLPTNNVWVKDTVLDGGLRATREIHFNDLRLDLPAEGKFFDPMVAYGHNQQRGHELGFPSLCWCVP